MKRELFGVKRACLTGNVGMKNENGAMNAPVSVVGRGWNAISFRRDEHLA